MPFQPGQSGNPAGRPIGSGRKWASMEYWFKFIERNIDGLKPSEQIAIAKWAMELLAGKMKEITTPEDSAATAAQAMELLKTLENKPVA